MITFEEFKEDVLKHVAERPKHFRFGQAVFNYIDDAYGIARIVQFEDEVDCFYRDELVDKFIGLAYNHFVQLNK